MLTIKIQKFLEAQKVRMVKLDRDQGLDQDPNSPKYYNEKTGRFVTGLEVLYDNCIGWLNGKEAFETLNKEFQMLENQSINEDTLATAAPTWTTTALPLIRRLYNNVIARELVSLQPLSQPSAYIFYLNKLYTNTHASDGITGGTTRLDQGTATTYANSSEQGTIREIQMSLQRLLVEVSTDKLKADFTLEAEQDWQSQYKINVESEMSSEMGDEIIRELDRRIFNALVAGAGYTVNWDPTAYRSGDTAISLYRHAYESEIYNALIDAQAWIMANAKGILSAGNSVDWNVVMSPANWARFAKLEHWNLTDLAVSTQTQIGRRYVGQINNLFKVYVTNEVSDCTVLLTAKASWLLSPGYYAPYTLYVSPRYIIDDDFTQFSKGIMSRQAYGIIPSSGPLGSTSNLIVKINLCVS